MSIPSSFGARFLAVQERVSAACEHSRRRVDSVKILAVTKQRSVREIEEAYEAGLRCFGENRVPEFLGKQSMLPSDIEWHMIGHLQSNKAKDCGSFSWVHSIDKLGTALALTKRPMHSNEPLNVLVEVNTSGEAAKDGVRTFEELRDLVSKLILLSGLRVRGLMTMAPFSPEEGIVRPCFVRLREWRDLLAKSFPEQDLSTLSMGMTNDFHWAIAEGSTLIRVGTALFEGFR